MNRRLPSVFHISYRSLFWHLKHHGVAGARTNFTRQMAELGNPVRPAWSIRQSFRGKRMSFEQWSSPRSEPRRKLWAGVILDDFTSLALSYEWNQLYLRPKDWREQLEKQPIDILFVESAWHGNNDSWRYLLTRKDGVYEPLANLVAWCQERGIPTVFWNKEDPAHFDEFLPVAKLFEYVYTTDGDQLDRYRKELGHNRIALLPFAAQTAIHYPHRSPKTPLRDVAFGGMYFNNKFPQRREQMDILLGGAHDASSQLDSGFDIFSRFINEDERYQFPEPLNEHVVGSLTYEQMLTAYRSYKVFLNVNSVVNSSTMCARRLFELSACAVPVLTTPSRAINTYFDNDEIVQVDDREYARQWVLSLCRSELLRDLYGYNAHMKVLSQHTYAHRINTVLSDVGLGEHAWELPGVSIMLCTNRPHNLPGALENCARQRHVRTQILVGTHGFEPSEEIRALAQDLGIDSVWVPLDSSLTLGACYNELLKLADYPIVAKMDDDDWYAASYLLEQVSALNSMGADLVGKASYMFRFHQQQITAWYGPQLSYGFQSFVAGPTIVGKRDLIREVQFPDQSLGEDTELLRRVRAAGGLIFSTSPFGFLRHRYPSGHTWHQDEASFFAHSTILEADSWRKR